MSQNQNGISSRFSSRKPSQNFPIESPPRTSPPPAATAHSQTTTGWSDTGPTGPSTPRLPQGNPLQTASCSSRRWRGPLMTDTLHFRYSTHCCREFSLSRENQEYVVKSHKMMCYISSGAPPTSRACPSSVPSTSSTSSPSGGPAPGQTSSGRRLSSSRRSWRFLDGNSQMKLPQPSRTVKQFLYE